MTELTLLGEPSVYGEKFAQEGDSSTPLAESKFCFHVM